VTPPNHDPYQDPNRDPYQGQYAQQQPDPSYSGQYPYQPYQGPYPEPQYYPPYRPPQDHPQATTALILGIVGVVVCQVVAPFAFHLGRKAMREIDASGGTIGGRGNAQAGYVLGIVGTVLLGLTVLFVVGYGIFIALAIASSS